MALTATVTNNTLTGSGTQDTLRTGANADERVRVIFTYVGGSNTTLKVWLQPTAGAVANAQLLTLPGGIQLNNTTRVQAQLEIKMGTSNVLKAEAGAASAIVYTVIVENP